MYYVILADEQVTMELGDISFNILHNHLHHESGIQLET